MATKNQYFKAVLKNQNKAWKSINNSMIQTFLAYEARLSYRKVMALCYTRVYCYITSDSFVDCDGNIDNVSCSDVLVLVEQYFEKNKIFEINNYRMKAISFEIYSDLFPDCGMDFDEFKDFC